MKTTAIIGLGCAGYHCIKALRENGYSGKIHVYTDVEHSTANPMLTTYYVSGKLKRDGMFPFGSLQKLTEDFNVNVHTGSKVQKVNTADKSVLLQDGSRESYDQILISTGAKAVSPPLGQLPDGRTFLMRTTADADRLKSIIDKEEIHSAAVIGASMVGIKIVELLHNINVNTTMIDMAGRLFPLACMTEVSQILEDDLKSRGISMLLNKGVDHIEESEKKVRTYLTDGQCLETDILVLCIGTRANTELVANTDVIDGEPVAVNRGIIVDKKMRTNIPDIYAAGDCCEALNIQTGNTMIIGLWANAAEQGRIAGLSMAGKDAEYAGSIPNNITHYFDQTFIGIGDPNIEGDHYCFENDKGLAGIIMKDGQPCCINILGTYRPGGVIRDYILALIRGEARPLTPKDEGLLRKNNIPDGFISLLKEGQK